MAKKDKKEAKKKSPLKLLFFTLFTLGTIVAVQLTSIFIIMMLMPSVVAYYCDMMSGKQRFHTIFACNLSGLLPFVCELIFSGNRSSDMMMMMGDVYVWFVIYLSAGFGWLLNWGCPKLAYVLIHGFHKAQVGQLEILQSKLEEEWGPAVKKREQV